MTEEDTFRLLRRSPYDVVLEGFRIEGTEKDLGPVIKEYLEAHGWTVYEFDKVTQDRHENRCGHNYD